MCGIASIFAYNHIAPPVDQEELLCIREAMINRGPDGAGIWISPDNRIGLAHRRLSIIDLSDSGAQPMASADGNFRITFNGEIYNHRELRRELEGKGFRFRSTSDTEVLLHLYADRGPDMVHALRGMYAFALWDESRRGLFLARDPFGIKPLYFSDDGSTLRVASQVKALLKGGAIDMTPEPAGHVGFYLWGHVPEPYTLYRGIRSLPAGTTLWLDSAGRKESMRFFNITEELANATTVSREITREEVHECLRAALLDSVRHHLVADVPVGVFLSAGLDSTTITALTKEVGNGDVHTITLGFREFQGTHDDEVPLANLTAKHYGTRHQTRWVTREDFRSARQHLLDSMDQPSTDGVNSYFVSKVAAESGLKVALSGLGGDELFGGYPSFQQIPLIVRAISPFNGIPALGKGFRYLSAPILKHFTTPKYASLLEYGGSYGGAYLLRRGMYMPWELPDVLDGEMVRQGWQELETLARLERTTQDVDSAHLRVTALETTWYMRNQLLRDTDWASMAHSLEVRVPLIDVNLFRATAPLFNSNSAPGKRAMARAPLKPLPKQVMRRRKTGFTVPVRKWLTPNNQIFDRNRRLREWARTIYREYNAGGSNEFGDTPPIALIFRTGQLGDTLVALPAIESIRRSFPKHRLVLLTDRHPSSTGYVSSWDICESTGWFDGVIYYQPKERGWVALRGWLSLLVELRSIKVDQFFNLAPGRSKWQTMRDEWFFGIAAGMHGYHAPIARRNPGPQSNGCLPRLEPEWRRTIRSVSAEEPRDLAFKLPIPEPEREMARRVALAAGVDFGSRLLAVAPGSKMPAKKWPADRFAELGQRIQDESPDLRLVVLGGAEDASIGQELCNAWGKRAFNLAGKLSIYGSAAVLEKCIGYVGNDTGTMHLAAMCSVPCVAIFSARDYPGRWDPYGKGHIVLRHDVECAGCFLEVCDQHCNKCLKLISVDEVHEATRKILAG